MAINISPASRDLTETGAIFNRAALRAEIARKRITFLRSGGMIAHYGKGDSWDAPSSVTTMVGRKIVKGDVSDYVRLVRSRLEEKAMRARRLHDERIERAARLQIENRGYNVTEDSEGRVDYQPIVA
jgi:hypothetical protein